jgi:hypothetical protein
MKLTPYRYSAFFLLVGIAGCTFSTAELEKLTRESHLLAKTIIRERKAGHLKETTEAVARFNQVNDAIKKYPMEMQYRVDQKLAEETALPKRP